MFSELKKITFKNNLQGFIPEVNSQIFASSVVSLEPELYTITSYSENERGIQCVTIANKRFHNGFYTCHLKDIVFYPEALVNSKFAYMLVDSQDTSYDNVFDETSIGFCFTPERAFELQELFNSTGHDCRIELIKIK